MSLEKEEQESLTPTVFADLFFGWKAFDYQVKPLDDMNKRVLMACGRQVGNLAFQRVCCIVELGSGHWSPNTTSHYKKEESLLKP